MSRYAFICVQKAVKFLHFLQKRFFFISNKNKTHLNIFVLLVFDYYFYASIEGEIKKSSSREVRC